jgi:hypothetical protein
MTRITTRILTLTVLMALVAAAHVATTADRSPVQAEPSRIDSTVGLSLVAVLMPLYFAWIWTAAGMQVKRFHDVNHRG